jgi:tRNA dimethylallyltransferase
MNKNNTHHRYVVFIYGPTASGKTDFASSLAEQIPAEIINMDSAQCYTPLTIGTAKPDWRNTPYLQHMFDCVNEPKTLTVHAYRAMVLPLIKEVWSRGNLPIFVGGSGFYLKSLLFPPQGPALASDKKLIFEPADNLWQELNAIDPDRARAIHPSDSYRIERALEIWHMTGKRPSEYRPLYDPPAPFILVHITRRRADLYERINKRVYQMIDQGWESEVASLLNSPWEQFVQEKKIIGYNEFIDYLKGISTLEQAIELIQQRSRNYAKRQETFWRMIKRQISDEESRKNDKNSGLIREFDLTYADLSLYIRQLLDTILLD